MWECEGWVSVAVIRLEFGIRHVACEGEGEWECGILMCL